MAKLCDCEIIGRPHQPQFCKQIREKLAMTDTPDLRRLGTCKYSPTRLHEEIKDDADGCENWKPALPGLLEEAEGAQPEPDERGWRLAVSDRGLGHVDYAIKTPDGPITCPSWEIASSILEWRARAGSSPAPSLETFENDLDSCTGCGKEEADCVCAAPLASPAVVMPPEGFDPTVEWWQKQYNNLLEFGKIWHAKAAAEIHMLERQAEDRKYVESDLRAKVSELEAQLEMWRKAANCRLAELERMRAGGKS